jgi:broad specificity phosphatase PhoE
LNLYFVRHGESEANIQHIISNRGTPFGLTQFGRQQAGILAGNLSHVPVTAIFSSPILRARETADILSKSFALPCQVTEALREYDCGILEDRSDDAGWSLHRKFYEDWTLSWHWEHKPEGGESFLDIRKRFIPFIESLKSSNNEHILLVGHGGLFHLMLPLILTNIDNEFVRAHGIGHTEYVIAELFDGMFVCKRWGNVQL